MFYFNLLFLVFLLLLTSCEKKSKKKEYVESHFIQRKKESNFLSFFPPKKKDLPFYPWEEIPTSIPKITRESFRCKGSFLNPFRLEEKNEQKFCYIDCEGRDCHSLPLKDGKEFVYPAFLELLNYIQEETKKKIVITSGHRCPTHNLYIDSSIKNQYSKHLMGAAVTFYVEGMEHLPEKVVALLQTYYQEHPFFQKDSSFTNFVRYEKPDTDVAIKPWYNKEIFIKTYAESEGRDGDNTHPFPYISLQIRWDRDLNERVSFSHDLAHKNFYRW